MQDTETVVSGGGTLSVESTDPAVTLALTRPDPEDDHTGAYLSWLARSAGAPSSEAPATPRGAP